MRHNVVYGIKSTLRTPLKSVLFLLLLAAATAFLSLGIGIWNSSENMLNDADSVFKTAGEFVFSADFIDSSMQLEPFLADAAERIAEIMAPMPQVLMFEENRMHRAVLEGYNQDRNLMPYGQYAVLFVDARVIDGVYSWDGRLSHIWETPYSARAAKDTLVVLLPQDDNPDQFTHRKLYAVFGRFESQRNGAYTIFKVMPFSDIGIDDAPYPSVIEIVDERATDVFWESEEGQFYADVISFLESANGSISVVISEDIMAVSQFHTGEYFIYEGEFFSKDDEFACIIPQRVAEQMQIAPGDRINLSIQYPSEETGFHNGYDKFAGYAAVGDYTVSGIYISFENEETIYLPYTGQHWAGHSKADPLLARVVLDNRTAESYVNAITPLLPKGISFFWNDQGYAGAIRPVLAMRETALTITTVCLIAFMFILWFFGLFFIYRNRESARILIALGTGHRGVLSFFLSGCGFISLCAAAIGGIIGYLASGSVTESVYASVANSRDLRFSIESYGLRFEDFVAEARTYALPFIITSMLVFIAALVVTMVFSATSHASHNPARLLRRKALATQKKRSVAHPKYIIATRIALPSVSIKHAIRSMLRGGKRSIAVPVLFAVLLSFLSVFSAIKDRFQDQLDNVYDDIPVYARFTDRRANRYDRLIIDEEQFDSLEELGFVKEMFRSANFLIRMDYWSPPIEWGDPESAFWIRPPYIPFNPSFAYDTFVGQLPTFSDPLTLTNNFVYAPEFMFSEAPAVTFLEGFSWESFYEQKIFNIIEEPGISGARIEVDENPDFLIVSSLFLEKHRLEPGSTAVFSIFTLDMNIAVQHPFVIGGVFESESGIASAYLPEIIAFVTQYTSSPITSNSNAMYGNAYETHSFVRFNSGGALLMNTDRLSMLKDELGEYYQQLGKLGGSRKWIVIDDKALNDSIDNLSRHIMYMDIAAPMIFALLVLLGFIISNLLLKSRTIEIGILRGIGTSQASIFAALIVEQLMLSIPGIVIGVLLPFFGGFEIIGFMQAALLVLCYFVGACAATLHTQLSKAISNLARKEE